MSDVLEVPQTIRWDEARTRGVTAAGHRIRILRSQTSHQRVTHVKLPPGGEVTDLFSAASNDADAILQAEELIQWPIIPSP